MLTPEREAEIRKESQEHLEGGGLPDDVDDLLAEIDALRARVAALEEELRPYRDLEARVAALEEAGDGLALEMGIRHYGWARSRALLARWREVRGGTSERTVLVGSDQVEKEETAEEGA